MPAPHRRDVQGIAVETSRLGNKVCPGESRLKSAGSLVELSVNGDSILISVFGDNIIAIPFHTRRITSSASRSSPIGQSGIGSIDILPSDNDPSVPFSVDRGQTLQFDDIVAPARRVKRLPRHD